MSNNITKYEKLKLKYVKEREICLSNHCFSIILPSGVNGARLADYLKLAFSLAFSFFF